MASKNVENNHGRFGRIILFVDLDYFYCQVEEKLNPKLKGRPLAVLQHNSCDNNRIIEVNYAARTKGVKRNMSVEEAKKHCRDIELVTVPNFGINADLSKYRHAGQDVVNVLQKFSQLIQRESISEIYLDITKEVNERIETVETTRKFPWDAKKYINTLVVGYENITCYLRDLISRVTDEYNSKLPKEFSPQDLTAVEELDRRLLIGASICNEIRAAVKAVTKYECSIGIAHNKIFAELACKTNGGGKQTIFPYSQISQYFETLPVSKIKGLDSDFGKEVCDIAKVTYVGQLRQYTVQQLQQKFGDEFGIWFHNICRGINYDSVVTGCDLESVGIFKRFRGCESIIDIKTLKSTLHKLAYELNILLKKDKKKSYRLAQNLVLGFTQQIDNGEHEFTCCSAPIRRSDRDYLKNISFELIRTNTKKFICTHDGYLNSPIKFLILLVKFSTVVPVTSKKRKIKEPEKNNENDEPVNTTTSTNTEKNKEGFFKTFLKNKAKQTSTVNMVVPEKKAKKNEENQFSKNGEAELIENPKVPETNAETKCQEINPEPEILPNIKISLPHDNPYLITFWTCPYCKMEVPDNFKSIKTHVIYHLALKVPDSGRKISPQEFSKDIVSSTNDETENSKPNQEVKQTSTPMTVEPENKVQKNEKIQFSKNGETELLKNPKVPETKCQEINPEPKILPNIKISMPHDNPHLITFWTCPYCKMEVPDNFKSIKTHVKYHLA